MTRSHRSPRETLKMRCAVAAIILIGIALVVGSSARPGRPTQQRPAPQTGGKFKTAYVPVKNKEYAEIQKMITSDRVLEELADDLNKTISLPVDVTLSFGECGEANAFYDPEKQLITFCYEFLEELVEVYEPQSKTEEELERRLAGAILHIFYHELGHALTHVLDLPVTGKEEDAVDQLATIILIEAGDEGEQAVLDASLSYLASYKEETKAGLTKSDFADEHSLSAQRFFNLICWVYGHNEEKYAGLVKKCTLPVERADRCAGEYEKISNSWGRLLEPYLKK